MIPLHGYAKAKKYVDRHSKLTDEQILYLKKKNPGPCLTISRESGIETSFLCERLVEELSNYYKVEWAYFDKEIIDKVISDYNLPERLQRYLSEERVPPFSQMLNELLGIHPPLLKLIKRMIRTIMDLGEIGNVILIGRGANIITMQLKNSYHIRLVAPIKDRIAQLQNTMNIYYEEAKAIMTKEDENRKDFLIRTFKQEIDNPLNYNQIINISRFNTNELIQNIFESIKIKYPHNQYTLKDGIR